MERYEYKYLSYFSTKKLLSEISQLEESGWAIYYLDSVLFFGLTVGLHAVLRRAVSQRTTTK